VEIADGGRTKKPSPPPCVCECGRRIRVSPTVLAAGPITCGVCGSDFLKLRISSRKELGVVPLINRAGSPFDAPDTTSNAGEPAVGTRAAVPSVDRGQSTIRPILSDVGEPCLGESE
jgi:hypothetical protein